MSACIASFNTCMSVRSVTLSLMGMWQQWRSQPKNFGGPKCMILGE